MINQTDLGVLCTWQTNGNAASYCYVVSAIRKHSLHIPIWIKQIFAWHANKKKCTRTWNIKYVILFVHFFVAQLICHESTWHLSSAAYFSSRLPISRKSRVPAFHPIGTGVKRPKPEAEQSSPSSAEVKNAWSHTSIFRYVFMELCLIKQCVTLCSVVLNSAERKIYLTLPHQKLHLLPNPF